MPETRLREDDVARLDNEIPMKCRGLRVFAKHSRLDGWNEFAEQSHV
jgi:hypothetical protein